MNKKSCNYRFLFREISKRGDGKFRSHSSFTMINLSLDLLISYKISKTLWTLMIKLDFLSHYV